MLIGVAHAGVSQRRERPDARPGMPGERAQRHHGRDKKDALGSTPKGVVERLTQRRRCSHHYQASPRPSGVQLLQIVEPVAPKS